MEMFGAVGGVFRMSEQTDSNPNSLFSPPSISSPLLSPLFPAGIAIIQLWNEIRQSFHFISTCRYIRFKISEHELPHLLFFRHFKWGNPLHGPCNNNPPLLKPIRTPLSSSSSSARTYKKKVSFYTAAEAAASTISPPPPPPLSLPSAFSPPRNWSKPPPPPPPFPFPPLFPVVPNTHTHTVPQNWRRRRGLDQVEGGKRRRGRGRRTGEKNIANGAATQGDRVRRL